MKRRAAAFGPVVLPAGVVFLGLWTLVVVVALVLQAIPVFLIAMLVALAFGVPPGAALTVVPIIVIAMTYLACVAASKITKSAEPD